MEDPNNLTSSPTSSACSAKASVTVHWSIADIPSRYFVEPSPAQRFNLGDLIGQGSFGKVYMGILWRNVNEPEPKDVLHAVKKVDLDLLNPREYELVKQEIYNMRSVKHPNLLNLELCIINNLSCLMVTPLMTMLSCDHILRTTYPTGLPELAIGFIIRELFCSLSYLHARNFIHRGIKASHIFISQTGQAKLAGFRHMVKLPQGQKTITDPNALVDMSKYLNWLAPEMLQQDRLGFGLKSDIYSVGITILELGNGVVPYSDISPPGILVRCLQEPSPKLWDKNYLPSQDSKDASANPDEVKKQNEPYLKKEYSKELLNFVSLCVPNKPEHRASLQELLKSKFYLQYAKRQLTLMRSSVLHPMTPVKFRHLSDKPEPSGESPSTPEWDFS